MKFSKSYEPGETETDVYAMWEKSGVFAPLEGEKTYSLVMPPPNANGNLHIGHGLTVAVEDALARYHRLRGEATWYVPGADHAGFETWVVYERELEREGKTRFDYSRDELYAQVWSFVEMQRGNMELQLRALGASCDWDGLTFTLDQKVVDRVYQTFHKMWDEGLVYRGEKLVNFCTKHQTAFADIEVVHEEEKAYLWDVAYPFVEGEGEIVVSTTRPETMFGDVAIAVDPDDERYKGVVGKKVILPIAEREIPVIADDMVDEAFGTGAVKITPAHDFNDFEVGERYGLPKIRVIGDDGKMYGEVPEEYLGLDVESARKKAVKELEERGYLRGKKKIEHSVGHCYKCGTVIEPMLREQWFVDVKPLAKRAIEALEAGEIKFYPASKKKVLVNYLKGLKDWNISRQIPWGIAIPMFKRVSPEPSSSATASPTPAVAGSPRLSSAEPADLAKLEDSGDSEWLFSTEVDKTEIEVDGVRYVRDEDTFDTWFSSSHWPIVCTEEREGFYPLNVMETAGDILFAWVARMIMMGLYVTDEVPFRDVYLHGLVLDEHGQKMSKSKGNVINPMEMISKYGSDAFRLGIIRSRSAGMNQAFSEAAVVAGRNLCNKLWNIARLVQGMVDEDSGASDTDTGSLPYSTENMGEDWICREIDECRKGLEKMYAEYRFAEAEEVIYDLIWNKYADWFLESQKMFRNTSLLCRTLTDILVMLHPMAPFVTETIWQTLSWTEGMCVAAKWPSGLTWDPISASAFEKVQDIVLAARRVSSALSGASDGIIDDKKGRQRYSLLYMNDALVDDNQVLIQRLTGVPGVVPVDAARGVKLAVANSEVYLDASAEVVAKYRDDLEERVLAVGRELDVLNMRMSNPRYVEKAPKELVEETQRAIREKEELIEGLRREMDSI